MKRVNFSQTSGRASDAAAKSVSKQIGGKAAAPVSRMELASRNSPRNEVRAFLQKKKSGKGLTKAQREKIKKVLVLVVGIFLVMVVVAGLWFFSYLQKLDSELPPIDNPFRDREVASVIYDRNGVELYKLFNEYNRDVLDIETIPYQVRWAFLAAEDIDFYTHQGFDPAAILRCSILNIRSGGVSCGGSTITQQMVKITTDSTKIELERKIKELLFAIKIEQAYTKDEILQLYLQVVPFGSNIYGLTSAADFYFAKEPKDLTLAEATILAAIINNPYYLSPTLGPEIELEDGTKLTAKDNVKIRQEWILNQIKEKQDKINDQHRINIEDPEADDLFSDEMVDEALAQELVYQPPVLKKNAGHPVDYALKQLQEGNYKDGEQPFSFSELQTGGYKIYLTIDYDVQQIAEQTVRDAVAQYGGAFGFSNSALITTTPSTGEIIAMAGSRDYNAAASEGCDAEGKNCLFDPQVNVMTSKQSPGSSTKPFGTYEAYRQGKLFYGSLLPDIPIEIVDGAGTAYYLKNWNGTFFGVTDKTTAGQMLRDSRNLPAIVVLETIGGTPVFLETLKSFGYSTFADSTAYGPSVILGGSDVLGVEHAQAYGVFANNGDLVPVHVISKIVDRYGHLVYEHKPTRTKVADERAAYMINETLLNVGFMSWDGRQVSSKSGTSQDNADVWMVSYSPDFVSIGWSGNNNNQPMTINAFGETIVNPWMKSYLQLIGDSEYLVARTNFSRPGGIVSGGGCTGECLGAIVGMQGGLQLEGVQYAPDQIRKKVRVCVDQPNRLARPVDEAVGMATDGIFTQYIISAPAYQDDLDKYLAQAGTPNGGPVDYCDVDRSGSGISGPFLLGVTVSSPVTSVGGPLRIAGSAFSTNGQVTDIDYYFDCNDPGNCTASKLLGSGTVGTNGVFDVTYNVPATYTRNGTYTVMLRITDATGISNWSSPFYTDLISDTDTNIAIQFMQAPPWQYGVDIGEGNSLIIRSVSAAGSNCSAAYLFVSKNGGAFQSIGQMTGGGGNYALNWDGGSIVTNEDANYTFYSNCRIPSTTTGTVKSAVSSPANVLPQ